MIKNDDNSITIETLKVCVGHAFDEINKLRKQIEIIVLDIKYLKKITNMFGIIGLIFAIVYFYDTIKTLLP